MIDRAPSNCRPSLGAFLLSVGVPAAVLFAAAVAPAWAERPPATDNSTLMYFPPIGHQEIGDCTCWSSCYYYNTYTQARDHGLDASTGNSEVICSPRFLFALIAQGAAGAECTEHAMARLSDIGCAPASLHPMSTWYAQWPTEQAWIGALRNRTGTLHQVRADDLAGLEEVKQHIADGGCAVTRALFHGNYVSYGATATGSGINNRVMYAGVGGNYLRHSLCICGYDDERPYYDYRDGQLYHGAFLIANSEGPDWGWYNSTDTGTKGFIWIAYNMFLEGQFGLYDNDDNPYTDPCYDNPEYPEIYYHDDRPDYQPVLYGVAGINHNARNLLTFSGGIGQPGAPEFIGPEAIERTELGDISINDSRRVAVDLTDGIPFMPPGESSNVFVSLSLAAEAAAPATITSVDFCYDFNHDGVYTTVPGEMQGPVTVEPGATRYVSATIAVPAAADFDADFDVDVADFIRIAGCLLGPAWEPASDCVVTDLAGDGDVDLGDFASFQRQFTGP
ncbi:MAG: hypothetical protein PVJ57_13365 [Phycisphaerae bacterium]|jgi:hypothetical protein